MKAILLRMLGLALCLAVVMSVGAVPASAAVGDVALGAFSGTASVGKRFTTADPCDAGGGAVVTGRGLYLPASHSQALTGVADTNADDLRERHAVFQFSAAAGLGVSRVGGVNATGVAPATFGISACGWIDALPGTDAFPNSIPGHPVVPDRLTGLGAACGASKGHNGQGSAFIGAQSVSLTNLGWKTAVGGLLPILGTYTQVTPAAGKQGIVAALVNAQGAGPCLGLKKRGPVFGVACGNATVNGSLCNNGNGATTFNVGGVFVLLNAGGSRLEWNHLIPKGGTSPLRPKKCKADGAAFPTDGEGKYDHSGKPAAGFQPCPTKPKP